MSLNKIIDNLDSLFNNPEIKNLWQDYINVMPDLKTQTQWCFSSDYCLNDKNKHNNCFVFTFFPYGNIEEISALINQHIPKDLKDTKIIPEQTTFFLKHYPVFFSIAFIVQNPKRIFQDITKQKTTKKIIEENLNHMITILTSRNPTAPLIRELEKIKQKNKRNSFDSNLCCHSIWAALFAAYSASFFTLNLTKINKLLWIPDRDSMNYLGLFELFTHNYNEILHDKKYSDKLEILGIATEDKNTNKFHFDSLVKIPDYIAGTIASYNLKENSVDKNKHLKLITEAFCDNKRILIIELNLNETQLLSRRITLTNKRTTTMPENKNILNTASFDPGFAPHVIHFYPALQAMTTELAPLKNFGQKKMRYKVLDKACQKALQSTLGFWVGCILWGGYIKYKFQDAPKPIEDNSFLELTKEDIPDFAYNEEFKIMAEYIENFAKNAKYYTGTNASLPESYKTILVEYKSFIDLNNHFLETRTSADIKIPAKFEFLAQYSTTQIDELGAKIIEIIETGDLSAFLELPILA